MSFNIQWYSSLKSTNEEMKKILSSGNKLKNYSIVATYDQTNGTGRFDRKWISFPNLIYVFQFLLNRKKILSVYPL